ncbi:MAG: YceI family protein [Burkholderiales bacterium]|nr:MAG: YceI family protein [Burkholderiales bacterium]
MKTVLLTLALAAGVAFPLAASAQQQMLADRSELRFVSRQMGVPVEGRFQRFAAQVKFDPARLDESRISFTVDTGSARINRDADAELPKPIWFNVAQFPQATFESSRIRRLEGNRFEVAGRLSIKGVSSDVVVPVTLAQSGSTTTASGSFPIRRLSFRIGEKEWADTSMVADEVQVRFQIALTGVPAL